jgi:hypothetical protein
VSQSTTAGGQEEHRLELYSVTGDFVVDASLKNAASAIIAAGPVIFAASGRTIFMLDSGTLAVIQELQHIQFDEVIASIALSPGAQSLAVCSLNGSAVLWRVSN